MIDRITKDFYYTLRENPLTRDSVFMRENQAGHPVYYWSRYSHKERN